MSLHIILLSGMDAKDTTEYMIANGFATDVVLENQIQRYVKTIGTDNPVRVTIWVALNTPLTQKLIVGIKYRMKNILFLYHAKKPLTMIRAHGWYKHVKATFDCSNYSMILASTVAKTPAPNKGYERMISFIANKFIGMNNAVVPHYAATLNKIFKQF